MRDHRKDRSSPPPGQQTTPGTEGPVVEHSARLSLVAPRCRIDDRMVELSPGNDVTVGAQDRSRTILDFFVAAHSLISRSFGTQSGSSLRARSEAILVQQSKFGSSSLTLLT